MKKPRNRVWELENPEKVKAMTRKSYLKHKKKRNAESKAWAEKNKEFITRYAKEYNKIWYEKNKEKRSAQIKTYGKAHPKENVIRTQRYVAKNKEKVASYNRDFSQTIEGKYRVLIYRAKHYEGTPITLQEFAILNSSQCAYCGDSGKIGIDRVDNGGGYTKENTAPACKLCNFMKKAMTVEEFLNHVEKIYKHNRR